VSAMTEAELLAFLAGQVEGASDPGAMTMDEMSAATGVPSGTLRFRVRRLVREGKMRSFRDWREVAGGHRWRSIVYRPVVP